MKNQKNIMNETSWLINMMSDDMKIHDFYVLKHYVITRIDKSKRAKRKKTTRNRWPFLCSYAFNANACFLLLPSFL